MKTFLFNFLSRLNKVILPSYFKKDLTRLSKFDQALIAYRLWVTKNSLR
ncbi:MAG: SsrA-binding protein [Vicingaceae bacterium]